MVKKFFFRFLELCLINAQKLYNIHRKSQNRKPLTLFFYAIQVCEALTDINKRANIPTQSSFQFNPKNFIDMKKLTPQNLNCNLNVYFKYKLKNCADEPLKKRAKQTVYQCPIFLVALCFGNCFLKCQTQEKYPDYVGYFFGV